MVASYTELEGLQNVWVFMGDGARHAAAVFRNLKTAETWITESQVSGVLTSYPLDISVFDWAVQSGKVKVSSPRSPEFVARFSSAYAEHYHYENGLRLGSV